MLFSLTRKVTKSFLHKLLVICQLIMLTGCMNVSIQSNVKPDDKPEFKRILVVSNLQHMVPTYLARFQTAFPSGYQVCTVSNSSIDFDSPEEAIDKKRQACQSEVSLSIDFNRNYTSGYGKYITSNNELLLVMTNLATNKPFWKAIVTTGGLNEVPPREIVQQLIKDGIIGGAIPLEKSYQSDY
ncbi:hypothetical protein GCM10028818_21050 [Spirosoma horti]